MELSNLSCVEKLEESRINNKIFSLTTEMTKNNIDEESTLDLAMTISKQKTICEISRTGFQIGDGKILDLIHHA